MYKPCTADLLSSGLVFFSTMGLRSVRTESFVLGLPFDTAGRGGKQGLNLSLPLRFGVWSQCPATFPHAECEQGKASLVSRGFPDRAWHFSKALPSVPVLLRPAVTLVSVSKKRCRLRSPPCLMVGVTCQTWSLVPIWNPWPWLSSWAVVAVWVCSFWCFYLLLLAVGRWEVKPRYFC